MFTTSRMEEPEFSRRAYFDRCSVLLFDPQSDCRRKTAVGLQRMGFRRIQSVVDFPELCQAAALGGFDLLVSEMGRAGGNAYELVKRLRHSTFGVDPFPAVVMTAADPQATQIQKAIKAGPDHILKWPFSDQQLAKRVRNIVDQRRPFIVTID